MTGPVMIESRNDALLWTLVDEVKNTGRDSREASEEFAAAYYRTRAAYWLAGGDWFLELMRETDPARLSPREARGVPHEQTAAA